MRRLNHFVRFMHNSRIQLSKANRMIDDRLIKHKLHSVGPPANQCLVSTLSILIFCGDDNKKIRCQQNSVFFPLKISLFYIPNGSFEPFLLQSML